MWSQDKLLNFWVLGTIQWGQASSLQGTVLSVLSPSSLFFFGHSLKAPCSSNPSLAPGHSWFLLAMGYGSPGAIMLCYSMAICWMNSQSTLSLYAYLAAFSSSPSLTLRRLWISLIIIACVTETWGGRYHPQEAFSVLTQCVCVCVCVCAVDDIACIQASLWWSTVSTGWHVSVYVCECVCICFSHHPRLYLQQWCWRRQLKLCSLII